MNNKTINLLTYTYLIISSIFMLNWTNQLLYYALNIFLTLVISDFFTNRLQKQSKKNETRNYYKSV